MNLCTSTEDIENRIAPLRKQLAAHRLYTSIQTPTHLRLFMESHVFAVWDFMSLLKSLQRALTCVEVPWAPTSYPASRRFINKIVLGEESDEYEGRPISHFELYLRAMARAGAKTEIMDSVVTATKGARNGDMTSVYEALSNAPSAARNFVKTTFALVQKGSLAAQAAAFTFGREDAIPDMFRALVRDLNEQLSGDLSQFVWYLQRHIEVDGDDHGPLSRCMVADLCGSDAELWGEAAQAAEDEIRARLSLWDGILHQLEMSK